MIELKGISKHFGAVQAVNNVSFCAQDGAITGLLGPNGAGKTTALRILCGLMKSDSGEAGVDGISVATEPLRVRQRLGVLPDARGLYRRLTARENIVYFGCLQGMSTQAAKASAQVWIDRLDMSHLADRRVDGFSQGERVKTALARALVHDPRNVVLDEPTNGLDVMATRSLRAVLESLRLEGRCILLSTHIMQEVAALCDQIVILSGGHVVAAGTPETLRAQTQEANLEDAFVKMIASAQIGHLRAPHSQDVR